MRSGLLDRKITIQSATSALDSYGQPQQTWTTFATCDAWKRDIKPAERFTANQDWAEETTTFRIRYIAGITPQMRIVTEGKTYGIESITELGRQRGLDLLATAEVNG